MKRVPITDLKNKLSEYLRLVRQGETIVILDRSVPIARIQGISDSSGGSQLDRLVRDGTVTPALEKPAPLEKPPIPCIADVAQAVIEERGDR